MNKVKRLGKTDITMEGQRVEKFAWGCRTCGRIFKLRCKAQDCRHIDIPGRFGMNHLGIDESIIIKPLDLSEHKCKPEDAYWLNDGNNIPLAKVCSKCEEEVKKKYNPWVFDQYTEADCECAINPEDYY